MWSHCFSVMFLIVKTDDTMLCIDLVKFKLTENIREDFVLETEQYGDILELICCLENDDNSVENAIINLANIYMDQYNAFR